MTPEEKKLAKRRAYYRKNKEKINEQRKTWQKTYTKKHGKEVIAQKAKDRYHSLSPEKKAKYLAKQRKCNKEFRQKNPDYAKAYYHKNREKLKQQSITYYQKNKEKCLANVREWHKKHPNYQANRYKSKKAEVKMLREFYEKHKEKEQ